MSMNEFDTLPKTVKKTVRYIKQDSTLEQLSYAQTLINTTINLRKEKLSMAINKEDEDKGKSGKSGKDGKAESEKAVGRWTVVVWNEVGMTGYLIV